MLPTPAQITLACRTATQDLGHPPVFTPAFYDLLVGICHGPIQAIRQARIPIA